MLDFIQQINNLGLFFLEWLEFTPYEVGLIKYGAYIRAEDFGSKFFMGRLMKKVPESEICYMKGDLFYVLDHDLLQLTCEA